MTATSSKLGADMTYSDDFLAWLKKDECRLYMSPLDAQYAAWRAAIESRADARQPAAIDKQAERFLTICSEERIRGSLTSLPLKLEFAKDRGMTLEQVHEWMRDTRRMFRQAIDYALEKRASKPAPSVEQDERRRFSSADEFDKWAAASEERADQGERAAFVKLMGYDLPSVDGAAKDVWEGQRTTWLEALEFAASTSANVAQGWRLVPERITDAMIESAMEAHYGKRRVRAHGGATGIAMTVNEKDYNGYDAMRRFWKGALAAAPAQTANVAQGAEAVATVKVYETYTGQNGWIEVTQEEYDRTKDKYEHRIRRVPAPPAQTAITDDARDAERYRWLRDFNVRSKDCVDMKPPCEHVHASIYSHAVGTIPAVRLAYGEELDRSIDAALTAAQSASGDTK